MKTFKINLSNKTFYTIISVIAILMLSVGVYAYGTSTPSAMGHSPGEIEVTVDGTATNLGAVNLASTGYVDTRVAGVATPSLNYQLVESTSQILTTINGQQYNIVWCPSGKVVVGGGCEYTPFSGREFLTRSNYVYSSTSGFYGWACQYRDIGGSGYPVQNVGKPYAICITNH